MPGGESSGGLTVRGHIHGKDSVYSSALACGDDLQNWQASERDDCGDAKLSAPISCGNAMYRFRRLCAGAGAYNFHRMRASQFSISPIRVSYQDGCKVYFADDSFVVCRFSGTEPLLRIFAEGHTQEQALAYIDAWKNLLGIC
ncbi:MAG: hypothetical protein R2912_04995 [Eubacteriales bacterium]